jgi:hypothetical protein
MLIWLAAASCTGLAGGLIGAALLLCRREPTVADAPSVSTHPPRFRRTCRWQAWNCAEPVSGPHHGPEGLPSRSPRLAGPVPHASSNVCGSSGKSQHAAMRPSLIR